MYSSELIRGTLKTIVLKLLKEEGKMYGYEITQKVKDLTAGKIQITEGALYPTLHSLEAEGFVTTETVHIGRRVRKYYKLTTDGRATARKKLSEMADFLGTMRILFGSDAGMKHA
ncbi:MAG TPA: PadR family transcriptional regulator [Bacteroidia bacterium]|nr:PadR family transcriptional regulator [Bacteroidia bacterium]